MNKIKTFKIKNEDGSLSDESYSLAVDARNVEMSNGSSAQDIIGDIDIAKEKNIKEQLTDINENIKTTNEEVTAISADIKKKAYFFNSVAEMKNAKLKAGDYAVTLGYYEANDGGSGDYLIRAKNDDDVEDGGSIHFLEKDKVAELIINDNVNIKQFGAYGDGIHDDTDAIQKAIDYVTNNINTIYLNISTIEFLTGKYIVSKTISVPIIVKIKIIGKVLILSNIPTGACIWINSDNIPMITDNDLIAYYHGANVLSGVINSNDGSLVIERNSTIKYHDLNIENSNSIGLLLGDLNINDCLRISRFKLANIAIHGFSIGLKINANNVYLIEFDNFYISHNRNNILYDLIDGRMNNSGENITFNRCIISNSYTAFKIMAGGGNFNFNSCSFDFLGCLFNIKTYSNNFINFNGGHIEGIGIKDEIVKTTKDNTEGFGMICYNKPNENIYQRTIISFFGTDFYLGLLTDYSIKKFISESINENDKNIHLSIGFFHSTINKSGDNNIFDDAFLSNDLVEITNYYNYFSNGPISYIACDNDNIGKLKYLKDEILDNNTLNKKYDFLIDVPGGYNNHPNLINNLSIDLQNGIFNNKSIKVDFNNCSYLQLKRHIENPLKNKIKFLLYFKTVNITGVTEDLKNIRVFFTVNYYNTNNIRFDVSRTIINEKLLQNEDGWYRTLIYMDKIPLGTKYISLNSTLRFENNNQTLVDSSGTVLFGGFITEFVE